MRSFFVVGISPLFNPSCSMQDFKIRIKNIQKYIKPLLKYLANIGFAYILFACLIAGAITSMMVLDPRKAWM